MPPSSRVRGRAGAASAVALVAGLALQLLGGDTSMEPPGLRDRGGRRAACFQRAARCSRCARRELDINVLMLVAVVGAMLLGEWAEAATVVFLFAIAQWLESRSMDRAREAIRALMDLTPDQARIRHDDHEELVPVDRVALGAIMVIRPGEKIPLDGAVVSGRSDVNQAPITGESLPVDKAPGDEVFAGTINGHGALEVAVTRRRPRHDARAHHSPRRERRRRSAPRRSSSSIASRAGTRRRSSRWRSSSPRSRRSLSAPSTAGSIARSCCSSCRVRARW